MSYLWYSAYVLYLLYIALFEWKSNEKDKCLPISYQPRVAGSKPPGGFMVRSIKRVHGTPRDLMINNQWFFNHLLLAVSACSDLLEKLKAFFSTKSSKNTCRFKWCSVLNTLHLKKCRLKINNCALLLDFLAIFWLQSAHALIF